ncbi:MAG TPA: glutamate--tRNA ligase, partial [Ferruginibacter sp.]|nr:glutamate--tRNA ligase [Ferruginibacter sp.]
MEELISKFSMERVHVAGARFDFEKAKWFNHEWIKKSTVQNYTLTVKELLGSAGISVTDEGKLESVLELVKDRCTLLPDFVQQSSFFFKTPDRLDVDAVKPKWTADKKDFFTAYADKLASLSEWNIPGLENCFKQLAAEKNIKPGDLQLPLRIMLVGGKYGPPVFAIAELLGKDETIRRINNAIVVIEG